MDDSFSTSQCAGIDEQRPSIDHTRLKISQYATNLLRQLPDIDRSEHGRNKHDILIIEDTEINEDDEKSLHNPVWELLEDTSHWVNTKPDRVNITRIICSPGCRFEERSSSEDLDALNSSAGLGTGKSVRILLVIARNLKHPEKTQTHTFWNYYEEEITPSIIQHSIMQVIEHLREIGHQRKIQLDILRPGSLEEIKEYLGVDSKNCSVAKREEFFDIIHLDMHGEMKGNPLRPFVLPHFRYGDPIMLTFQGRSDLKQPHFKFTVFPDLQHRSNVFVSATEVAISLSQRTNFLVMNACNSSSPTGGLGIQMIRTFLKDRRVACVAATSYRLLEETASIFYPTFYMSLLMNGSFNRAAAEGRRALRDYKIRYGEERDDAYVQWNWSSTVNLHKDSEPSRSNRLHFNMLLELLPRSFFLILACVRRNLDKWRSTHAIDYPMYDVHQNFRNMKAHVNCCQQVDIPKITLHAMEIEYYLKTNIHHALYLHPARKNSYSQLRIIKTLVLNMIRIWIDTNFVTEIRILDVEKMLKRPTKSSWPIPLFWTGTKYEDLMKSPDWSWQQQSQIHPRVKPKVKSMLIIYGIEQILPLEYDDGPKSDVLDHISKVAQQIEETHRDLYVLTIGGLLTDSWQVALPSEFAQRTIGRKWSSRATMMIPYVRDVELCTYSRKVRAKENIGQGAE